MRPERPTDGVGAACRSRGTPDAAGRWRRPLREGARGHSREGRWWGNTPRGTRIEPNRAEPTSGGRTGGTGHEATARFGDGPRVAGWGNTPRGTRIGPKPGGASGGSLGAARFAKGHAATRVRVAGWGNTPRGTRIEPKPGRASGGRTGGTGHEATARFGDGPRVAVARFGDRAPPVAGVSGGRRNHGVVGPFGARRGPYGSPALHGRASQAQRGPGMANDRARLREVAHAIPESFRIQRAVQAARKADPARVPEVGPQYWRQTGFGPPGQRGVILVFGGGCWHSSI